MTQTTPDATLPNWSRAYRLVFAIVTFVAIGWQLWVQHRDGWLNVGNFFSFFTIQSNIIAAVVFLLGASTIRRFTTQPDFTWDMIRAATAMYMATTGIVYNTLLTGLEDSLRTSEPWVNTTLHIIMPIVVVADFIVLPIINRITFGQALTWTAYPLAYLAYSLIRGPIVDWYPYPFLDPREDGGYARVALYCVAILIGFLVISWIILRIAEWRGPSDGRAGRSELA
jgi:hypothetical protein